MIKNNSSRDMQQEQILLEKKVLEMDGNIPHSEYALTENNKRRVLNETQLLSDAKLRGFYQNPSITYDLLEETCRIIDLQELKLTVPQMDKKNNSNLSLNGLTLKDVVARTATKNSKTIRIGCFDKRRCSWERSRGLGKRNQKVCTAGSW